jgi:uncharacterized protein YbaR (Trm112 family)
MHLLLTDRLACPRCGPEFGLILLADQISERWVRKGSLGCPNCRDRFPIMDSVADLRPPPRTELPAPAYVPPGLEGLQPIRAAAFLGIPGGPGSVLLAAGAGHLAAPLAGIVEGVQWISADPTGLPAAEEAVGPAEGSGVNRIIIGRRIPFFSASLRGVVLGAAEAESAAGTGLLEEAARAVSPRGRVVVLSAGPGVSESLERAGLDLVLDQDGVVIAARKS